MKAYAKISIMRTYWEWRILWDNGRIAATSWRSFSSKVAAKRSLNMFLSNMRHFICHIIDEKN